MIRRRRCGAMRGRTRRRPSWPSVKQPAALGCLCDSLSASFSWRGNVACAFAADWISASNALVCSPHCVLHDPVCTLSLSFHQRRLHVEKMSSSSCGTGSWLYPFDALQNYKKTSSRPSEARLGRLGHRSLWMRGMQAPSLGTCCGDAIRG